MTQDYIGQELIWKLRGNHPYESNYRDYRITFNCKDKKAGKDIADFIFKHTKPEWIADVTKSKDRFQSIKINNVFGLISEVNFYYEV